MQRPVGPTASSSRVSLGYDSDARLSEGMHGHCRSPQVGESLNCVPILFIAVPFLLSTFLNLGALKESEVVVLDSVLGSSDVLI